MLQEAIKALVELGHKADEPKIQKPAPEPDHIYLLDGKRQTAEPEPRAHQAADLSAVVAFAQQKGEPAAVWYSREGVVCLLDDATRRDRIDLKLRYSPQLCALMNLDTKPAAWEQAALIRWLRVNFAGCLPDHPEFLALLRELRWQSSSDAAGSIQHGKASVGRSIEATLGTREQLPETVTFDVPIFLGCLPQLRGAVPCALDISHKDERLVLIPLAGAIEGVVRAAEEKIGALLEKELGEGMTDQLYYGVP